MSKPGTKQKTIGNRKRYILIIGILILLKLVSVSDLSAQQLNIKDSGSDIRNFKEDLFVRTDRDIYITGEQVWLKVYKITGLTSLPNNLSKVIYVELLDKNNLPLRQVKVKAENFSASAVFSLPDNISSGNYLIRAYTNWMQNFSADHFSYSTISVINPFESIDHLKLTADKKNSDISGILVKEEAVTAFSEAVGDKPVKSIPSEAGKQTIKYSVVLDSSEYSARSKVKMIIKATGSSGEPLEADMSISVSRSVLVKPQQDYSFKNSYTNEAAVIRVGGDERIAELVGPIISGYIRMKGTDEPVKKTGVSLSFVGKTARCQFVKTDEKGKFNFVVKDPGLKEIVIQALSPEITGYYIDLNQPFSNNFTRFRLPEFFIDSSKITDINKAIVAMQVNNIYTPYRKTESGGKEPVLSDFYGIPENSVKMSDYIELTSLREVVKEILPNVYTLKQNGKYDFKLINKFLGQPFENKPLVLVDGVPIYDIEKVLNINSKEIEKADIINTRYFYSENVFDGILSFITKKGNLSVLDFDNSVFRQVYEGCQAAEDFYSPAYNTTLSKQSRIPDFRNTLYWSPNVHTGKDGKAEIEFFTSDESAVFTVVIEGMSSDGKTGYSSASLRVK